jgi:hypothetical protein
MTALTFPRRPQAQATSSVASASRTLFAVCLIDRRTGQPHRVNGSALVLFTRSPEEAAADLLQGRDTTVWEVLIEPLGPQWRE